MHGAPGADSSHVTRGKRRYHFHLPGVIFVLIALLLGLGAINSQNNMLFLLFGLALAALLVAGVLSGATLLKLRAQRAVYGLVGSAGNRLAPAAGDLLTIQYRLANRSRFIPAFALTLTELARAGHGRRRHGWTEHITAPLAFVAHAGPKQTVHAEAIVRALRRGRVELDCVRITTLFPFGLVRKSIELYETTSFIIHPRPAPLRDGALESLLGRRDHEIDTSSRRGQGTEFFSLREYRPGDSPRNIAWRSSARLGTLITRETADAVCRRLCVTLILPSSEQRAADVHACDARAEEAISLAAGVLEAAYDLGFEVGLNVPQASISIAPARSRRQRQRMLDALALIDLEGVSTHPAGAPSRRGVEHLLVDGTPSSEAAPAAFAGRRITPSDSWILRQDDHPSSPVRIESAGHGARGTGVNGVRP